MKSEPWKKYAVGKPSRRKKWTEPDCAPFDVVAHVTHLRFGLEMLQDGVMRPRLVWDESKLNDRRILVNWLSPNHWTIGYRYGNVRFNFDIESIRTHMNCYWVEVGDYTIKAPRILLSTQQYDSNSGLMPYDPAVNRGPWWFDASSGLHYFNSNYCLELLIEREIDLSECQGVEFVNHHDRYCSVNRTAPTACRDLGRRSNKAGAVFLASAVVNRLGGAKPVSTSLRRLMGSADIEWHWEEIRRQMRTPKNSSRIGIAAGDSAAPTLGRALLLGLAQENLLEAQGALRLFKSDQDAAEACAALVESTLGLKTNSLSRT